MKTFETSTERDAGDELSLK